MEISKITQCLMDGIHAKKDLNPTFQVIRALALHLEDKIKLGKLTEDTLPLGIAEVLGLLELSPDDSGSLDMGVGVSPEYAELELAVLLVSFKDLYRAWPSGVVNACAVEEMTRYRDEIPFGVVMCEHANLHEFIREKGVEVVERLNMHLEIQPWLMWLLSKDVKYHTFTYAGIMEAVDDIVTNIEAAAPEGEDIPLWAIRYYTNDYLCDLILISDQE